MCAPAASALPLAVGGMQAFGGMMEAQGQYASQRDAVNAFISQHIMISVQTADARL